MPTYTFKKIYIRSNIERPSFSNSVNKVSDVIV